MYLQRHLLKQPGVLDEYNRIIEEQLHKGIVEKVYLNEVH